MTAIACTDSDERVLWRFALHAAVLEVAIRSDGGERVADDEHRLVLELFQHLRPVGNVQFRERRVQCEVVRLLQQRAAAIQRQRVRTVG